MWKHCLNALDRYCLLSAWSSSAGSLLRDDIQASDQSIVGNETKLESRASIYDSTVFSYAITHIIAG